MPSVEDAARPNCTPITGWKLTLGTGIQTRAVSGPWGSLSIVTNPYAGTPTKAETPLLSSTNQDTGKTIKGAVTIELTPAQAAQASRPSSLWIQGGTPTDPILNQTFPDQYGFGALRCAIDNLTGDNVEWIGYPQGATRVFCFTNLFTRASTGGEGGGGDDGDVDGSGNPTNPKTDLEITKSVSPRTIALGQEATYTVVVRNISSLPAENVTVAERRRQPGGGALRMQTTQGTCTSCACARRTRATPGTSPRRTPRPTSPTSATTAPLPTLTVRPRPLFTG